jgi:hypothetical protein
MGKGLINNDGQVMRKLIVEVVLTLLLMVHQSPENLKIYF